MKRKEMLMPLLNDIKQNEEEQWFQEQKAKEEEDKRAMLVEMERFCLWSLGPRRLIGRWVNCAG
jgi:hypothetical protein